ncbi:uncharacterized protein FFB14_07579 [Fusarium fujikuroi]|nr:uncharacterized protein FFB14_07579 [Fusarium fujikuroi]
MSSSPKLTPTKHFNKTAKKYEAATGATREHAQQNISSITALKPLN